MLYIISGNDNKKINAYIKKISGGFLPLPTEEKNLSKEYLISVASSQSLFSEDTFLLIENFFELDIELSKEEIETISKSKNIFIFTEDKISSSDLNKYKKYSTIENFVLTEKKEKPKNNVFDIAFSFGKRDKLNTWLTYKNAIASGSSPEEISGIIFWKIKTMTSSNIKTFTPTELKEMSSRLVSLYHDSHLGKKDFTVGLEQFILSSLEK